MQRATAANPFYTRNATLSSLRVLEQLAYLNTHARKTQARLHPALHPTRAWLAKRCGVTVATISRSTARLAAAGHLRKAQTRSKDGHWRPTWYWLAAGAADRIRFALARLTRHPRRVTSSAHLTKSIINENPDSKIDGAPALRSSLKSTLQLFRAGTTGDKPNCDAPPPAGLFGRGE